MLDAENIRAEFFQRYSFDNHSQEGGSQSEGTN